MTADILIAGAPVNAQLDHADSHPQSQRMLRQVATLA